MMSFPDPFKLAQERVAKRNRKADKTRSSLRDLKHTLSPAHRRFISSRHPRKALDGSRQSGKSRCIATDLILAGFSTRCDSMYVAPTSKSARSSVWSKFYEINNDFDLRIEMREGRFEARMPNGSSTDFEGAHDRARVQRLRGKTITEGGKLVIDESAFMPDGLFRELLGPVATAMFLTGSQSITIASTPGLQKRGRFYELVNNSDWEHHHFTLSDNPIVKDVDLALSEMRIANGWIETTPAYIREGLGLWCDDLTHNVYELTDINLVDEMPDGNWTSIVLVDFGKTDQSAIAVDGWLPYDKALYVRHVEGHSNIDIEDLCQKALPLIEKYKPIGIYGDSGGGGAQHMEYMRKRHRIPILPVSKKPHYKMPAIRELNAEMRRGNYKVLRSSPLVEQMQNLQWDPSMIGEAEHPSMPNDLCDVAGVYAYVQSRHYRAEEKPKPEPRIGTKEYLERWSDESLMHAIEQANKEQLRIEEIEEERAYLLGDDL